MRNLEFQIGQCRVYVDTDKTKNFYKELPRISENCSCDDCDYFENEVIKKDIGLFRILNKMGVDLKRQPNINPDGVSSVGETDNFRRSYMGYYKLFGNLGKVQKSIQNKGGQGKLESVDFYEPEDDSYTQYKIKQENDDQLTIDFYIECEKKK